MSRRSSLKLLPNPHPSFLGTVAGGHYGSTVRTAKTVPAAAPRRREPSRTVRPWERQVASEQLANRETTRTLPGRGAAHNSHTRVDEIRIHWGFEGALLMGEVSDRAIPRPLRVAKHIGLQQSIKFRSR